MPTMETDIEVLKSQVGGLREVVDGINTKLDSVLALQESLVRLQEQHTNTRQALERAFNLINDSRIAADTNAARLDRWVTTLRTGLAAGAVIIGMVQWYAMKRDNDIERTGDTLVTLERRIAWIEHDKYGRNGKEPAPPGAEQKEDR